MTKTASQYDSVTDLNLLLTYKIEGVRPKSRARFAMSALDRLFNPALKKLRG